MNFRTISTILAFLSFDLLALSTPVNNKVNSTDAVEIFTTGVDNTQNVTNEQFLMGEAEVTDISSEEEEEEIIIDKDVEEVTEIDSTDEDENVCTTKECIEVSNNILNSIDPSVDPCEDFYQFTCGNYIKNHKVDEENIMEVNFISSSIDHTNEMIKIFEGEFKPNQNLSKQDQEYDKIVFNKIKSYFESCVNFEENNKKGRKPMVDLLDRLNISENKDKYTDPNELAITLAKFHQISEFLLFSVDIKPNNKREIELTLSQTTPDIKVEDKNKIKDQLLEIFEGTERKNDIEKWIDFAYEFEMKLFGNESFDNMENNDDEKQKNTDETVSIKTLNEKYPNINWKLYFEEKFNLAGVKDIINDDTEIKVTNVEYIENLNKVLSEVDGETLSYYFEFYFISFFSMYKEQASESTCYYLLNNPMKYAIAKYYVEHYFSPSKKQYAEKVIEYIKQSMMNRIPNIEWLDDETIEYAYKKVAAMKEIIGYPDFILDSKIIYNMYKDLEFTKDDFYLNLINGLKFAYNTYLKEVVRMKLEIDPQNYNAYYDPYNNEMLIPAGSLQSPLFNEGVPNYINYSSIGFVIGHEFTHAFDNSGKNYDMDGNYFNWWTANDVEEYEDLTKCFINQYNQLYMEDLEGKKHYIDGKFTLDENIADNGGLPRAYESWKLSLMEDPETVKKENQKLPGLTQYTPEQLFFINYGNIWCENIYNDGEYIDIFFEMDVHSRNFARVNGVVSNYEEFAKVFNCPLRSKMNPENKCGIW